MQWTLLQIAALLSWTGLTGRVCHDLGSTLTWYQWAAMQPVPHLDAGLLLCAAQQMLLVLQYEMADYRKKLYNDIVRRKKELRRKQREREGTSSRSRSSRPRTSGDGTDKYYRR